MNTPRPAATPAFDDIEVLRTALEAVPDAMLVVDAAGIIRHWNCQAEALFGYAAAEACGQPIERVIPERFVASHRAHRAAYAQAPRRRPMGIGMELRGLRRDGSEVPVEVSLSPVTIGGAAFVVASVRDMGPTRRAEEDRQRLQRQDTLIALWELALRSGAVDECLRSAADALQAVLAAQRIVLYELAPERRPPQLRALRDTAGTPPFAWQALAQAPHVAALISEERATNGDDPPAVAMQLRSNAVENVLALSLRAQSRLLGAMLIVMPRERVFASEDLYFVQSVAHLLAGVLARAYSDQLLLSAARMETLGQISGGIAHDFNNLLSIIAGNLELVQAHVHAQAPLDKLVQAGLRAARRGGELTQRLLLFARKRTLQPVPQRLDDTLAGLADLIARVVGDGIRVQVDAPERLPEVSIDPSVLDACVINLATNARDAMPAGGTLRLRVGLAATPPAAAATTAPRWIALAVADSGCGMDDAVAQRAFEPFYTTKDIGKGTGLGLSLVQTLMQQAGGHVVLDSAPGAGTTVTLYFPLREPADDVAARTALPTGAGETVLLVEDDPAVRETAALLIDGLGYRVRAVANVAEAKTALADADDEVALVFSDVLLGRDETGLQLAAHLRATRPGLPVILTSGYARPVFERHERPLDDVELLRKPYSRAQLALALRDALARARPT